ncbi:MAG TPA: ATP-binding protein [Solirubrobacteraceae bacterium]|jgi:DNA transposition AAA+ family ATPase|nr:ATP-binding protein [Solirubrobacteraceae bacterium]
MTAHFLGLKGAATLQTRHLLLTRKAIDDVIEAEAMGAIVGPAGLGKTFAVSEALKRHTIPIVRLTFESRPTMRLVADRLLNKLTGKTPSRVTRFLMTDELLSTLSKRRRLVVIGEAQNLNRDCFEYLRHLHDDPDTRFGLLFDGGDGCWDVISREPMLRSRIYRPVNFAPLSEEDILTLIPTYHQIYKHADPELLLEINDRVANGRMRSWAAFTKTADEFCQARNADEVSPAIAQSAIAHLAAAD